MHRVYNDTYNYRIIVCTIGKSDYDLVSEEIKLNSPICPKLENRIILLNVEHVQTSPTDNSVSSRTNQQKPQVYDAVACGNNRKNISEP